MLDGPDGADQARELLGEGDDLREVFRSLVDETEVTFGRDASAAG